LGNVWEWPTAQDSVQLRPLRPEDEQPWQQSWRQLTSYGDSQNKITNASGRIRIAWIALDIKHTTNGHTWPYWAFNL